MTLSGRLTSEEYAEASRLVRPKSFWPKFILKNLYGALLLFALAGVTLGGLFGHAHVNWRGLGWIWGVVLLLACWAVWSTRQSTRKQVMRYNKMAPEQFIIEPDGIYAQSSAGNRSFDPWSTFRRLKAGSKVYLLLAEGGRVQILPLSKLTQAERDALKGNLDSFLAATNRF